MEAQKTKAGSFESKICFSDTYFEDFFYVMMGLIQVDSHSAVMLFFMRHHGLFLSFYTLHHVFPLWFIIAYL